MNLIQLKKITKSYSPTEKALKEINLDIKQGEFIALMGESGAGKTSLLNILGLIDEPSSGEYLFEEESVGSYDERKRTHFRRKKLGFIFQFFNLLPALNVMDNVAVPLHLNGVKHFKQIAREKLAQVGILELKDRPLNTLSGGQMQRVAIARAIAHNPKLILADEPTGNLDSKTAADILELMVRLKKEDNITIVMATHSKLASKYANRILNISDGLIETV
ncbi:MAG: ABC transporter ATP-binding protein [Candidatus Caenarcaniphilales bacterium]|nr:ABC transporter ATP-binding protein [Candidatus Caenarcaniphilales bacterium]